jgi:hypothetical protein
MVGYGESESIGFMINQRERCLNQEISNSIISLFFSLTTLFKFL